MEPSTKNSNPSTSSSIIKKTSIAIILCLKIMPVLSQKIDSLLQVARVNLSAMNFSKAFDQLNAVEDIDSINAEMPYLKTEVYLINGMDKYFTYLDKLAQLGSSEEFSILKTKHQLFLKCPVLNIIDK